MTSTLDKLNEILLKKPHNYYVYYVVDEDFDDWAFHTEFQLKRPGQSMVVFPGELEDAWTYFLHSEAINTVFIDASAYICNKGLTGEPYIPNEHPLPYDFMHALKSGHKLTRYGMIRFKEPHVIVFSRKDPDHSHISKVRAKVIQGDLPAEIPVAKASPAWDDYGEELLNS